MSTVIERPLYQQIQVETTSTSGAFSWVDQTRYMTFGSYSLGKQTITLGDVGPDIGNFTASFRDMATVPTSGDYIRVRRYGTTEYAFTGYVTDVAQRIVYDLKSALSTPIVLTTVTALDWVGLLTQVQVDGIDGMNSSYVATGYAHYLEDRVRSLNNAFDSTNATELIEVTTFGAGTMQLGLTDYSGSIADHLDLAVRSSDGYWFGNSMIPTNSTTGRDKMVSYRRWTTNVSTGKTFTDVAGSAGQLHYTEIDLESSSQTIANNVTVTNRCAVRPLAYNILTKVGGASEDGVVDVNHVRQYSGVMNDEQWVSTDATSIASYGNRRVEIETCRDTPIALVPGNHPYANLIANPSLEYDDNGYSVAGSATSRGRRRQPSFGAASGGWAHRWRITTAGAAVQVLFSGGESDAIPVVASQYYYFKLYAARDTTSRNDVQVSARINWYDENEAVVGSGSLGTFVPLTTANTWYAASVLGQAPVGAVRAVAQAYYTRSGGGNHSVGDMGWTDAMWMMECDSSGTTMSGINYFDGDTATTTGLAFMWSGQVNASQSIGIENTFRSLANDLLARFTSTSIRATRIRWNAQESLASVSSLTVGNTISLVYRGTTTTYRIIGINGDISQDRYMLDLYLWKI
jgi:hypothetical protein